MKRSILSIFSIIAMLFFVACTEKVAFQRSSVVPAAEADVKVKTDRNGNYELSIEVSNLAQPENLSPARDTYVVWMQASDRNTYNLGELVIGNNLSGKLTAVTPHKPVKVYITAEDNATGRMPSTQVVLESNDF